MIAAIVSITLALLFYTIGVWWERKDRELRKVHILFFCMGLVCDITGTTLMSVMAKNGDDPGSGLTNLHGITGLIAIVLMLFHAVWALIVLVRGKDVEKQRFHRFSIFVWMIWLIPFVLGMVMGMGR